MYVAKGKRIFACKGYILVGGVVSPINYIHISACFPLVHGVLWCNHCLIVKGSSGYSGLVARSGLCCNKHVFESARLGALLFFGGR